MISFGKATLHELQTVYSIEDALDMVEIVKVDSDNAKLRAAWDRANRNVN